MTSLTNINSKINGKVDKNNLYNKKLIDYKRKSLRTNSSKKANVHFK